MKINDSTYSNQSLLAAQGTQGVGKANQQAVVAAVDENNESNKRKSVDKDKSRFEVSEKAIALLDEQAELKASAQSASVQSGLELAIRADQNSSSSSQANQTDQQHSQYDQSSQQNLSAVAAYQSVDNIAQRENIKQFFGVNLFA